MREVLVGKVAEFPVNDCRILSIDGVEVGIFNVGEKLIAYENRCPHMGGPVCQGKLFNKVEEKLTEQMKSIGLKFGKDRHVVCLWHGYEFNIETVSIPAAKRSACATST